MRPNISEGNTYRMASARMKLCSLLGAYDEIYVCSETGLFGDITFIYVFVYVKISFFSFFSLC